LLFKKGERNESTFLCENKRRAIDFFNIGGATANNFFELIKIAKSMVFDKFNILLQEEIIGVGEF